MSYMSNGVTDMLADAVVSFAEATRDRRAIEFSRNDSPEMSRAMESIRFVAVSKNGCYGVKATAHPSLSAEVTNVIDAVTRMNGHPESGPILRTETAVLYRWQ